MMCHKTKGKGLVLLWPISLFNSYPTHMKVASLLIIQGPRTMSWLVNSVPDISTLPPARVQGPRLSNLPEICFHIYHFSFQYHPGIGSKLSFLQEDLNYSNC